MFLSPNSTGHMRATCHCKLVVFAGFLIWAVGAGSLQKWYMQDTLSHKKDEEQLALILTGIASDNDVEDTLIAHTWGNQPKRLGSNCV